MSHTCGTHTYLKIKRNRQSVYRGIRQVKAYTAGAMRARDGRCGKLGRAPHMPRIASIITHKSSARVHVSFKISFAQRLFSESDSTRLQPITHTSHQRRGHTLTPARFITGPQELSDCPATRARDSHHASCRACQPLCLLRSTSGEWLCFLSRAMLTSLSVYIVCLSGIGKVAAFSGKVMVY